MVINEDSASVEKKEWYCGSAFIKTMERESVSLRSFGNGEQVRKRGVFGVVCVWEGKE